MRTEEPSVSRRAGAVEHILKQPNVKAIGRLYDGGAYSILGALCEYYKQQVRIGGFVSSDRGMVFVFAGNWGIAWIPPQILEWFGLTDSEMGILSNLNDCTGLTLHQIASYLGRGMPGADRDVNEILKEEQYRWP